MLGHLAVAALNVEAAQDGFTDQGCYDGNPQFQAVDDGGVGAELSEDLQRQASLEVPGSGAVPWWEYDCPRPFSMEV